MLVCLYLVFSTDHVNLSDPVQVIFPEDQIQAVALGFRSFMLTTCKIKGFGLYTLPFLYPQIHHAKGNIIFCPTLFSRL